MEKISISKLNQRWDELSEEMRGILYNGVIESKIESLAKENNLNDNQLFDLGIIFQNLIYGFLTIKETFEEIKSSLNTDAKTALSLYSGLSAICEPIKNKIEENYIKNKKNQSDGKNIVEPSYGSRQVNLKQGETVLDLKKDDVVAKVKASAEPTPFILGRINIDQNVPVNTARPAFISKPASQPIQVPPQPSAQRMTTQAPPLASKITPIQQDIPNTQPKQNIVYPSSQIGGVKDVEIPGGPMIIHRHEEAQSVGATRPSGTFKQATFGGAFGSYRSNPAPKSGPAISRAQVTMSPSSDMIPKTEQKVPLTVKSFDNQNKTEPTKVIHYSAFMTPIGKPAEPSKDEGSINLDKMTFTK